MGLIKLISPDAVKPQINYFGELHHQISAGQPFCSTLGMVNRFEILFIGDKFVNTIDKE
jgi:hypothetical protein